MTDVTFRQFSGTAAENYERYFVPAIARPVSGDLLRAAALEPGERVLDVACGTGVITRLAAEQVGSGGTVVGVDLAPDMIQVARSLPAPDGATVDWRQADATSLPLADGSFDVVLSQMGLMFVQDKVAAVAEMRRVLADGGRLAINTPGAIQPPFEIFDDALGRHVNPDLAGFVRVIFSMHDPQALRTLLAGGGFRDVDVTTTTTTLRLPPPADFLWQYISLTPLGAFVSKAPEEARNELERSVVEGWQQFVGDDGGMVLHQPMLITTARA